MKKTNGFKKRVMMILAMAMPSTSFTKNDWLLK